MSKQRSGVFEQQELDKSIDNELKNVVREISLKELKVIESPFKGLFAHSQAEIKRKLAKRLESLSKIKPANDKIQMPPKFRMFLFEAMRWLEKASKSPEDVEERSFFKDFKLSETGDIYKGERKTSFPHGKGICITCKNNIIESKFKDGRIIPSEAKILYENGEFYEGKITFNGVRDGKGVYYYANGDIYDGEFIQNKRVGKSRLRFNDGSEYIGQFIEDEADGHGIFND